VERVALRVCEMMKEITPVFRLTDFLWLEWMYPAAAVPLA
jgi:hypothetical protein